MPAKEELRDYLRTRRARLQPADVGLPDGASRRVPGLRREEIALLAGVSVDYYVRLEQGRGGNVSLSVLDAVARALQLDEAERQHLIDLAQPAPLKRRASPRRQRVRPAVAMLLDALDLQPAFVMGDRMDVLAINSIAHDLMGGFMDVPANERNLARFIFLDPSARDIHTEWSAVAEETVAMLRLYAGGHPDDPELSRLVGDLSLRSPEFVHFWAAHDVRSRAFGTKSCNHPQVGEMILNYEALVFPGDNEQRLCVYSAEPGSVSEERMRLLASMHAPESSARATLADVTTASAH
ncbi:helix-turn-helix transcriptional regulator [Glaciihabitans sp. dw_435]|uniref:helix-turn-helix transcriptional regulator n=1 Tax=Glaciihabitans sp. dw_435 TaxID=2720081 RepID=UPI001BD41C97|nr:helix-turn-helix transcriptional regulator [Glaciihabitans sp. dw_435]